MAGSGRLLDLDEKRANDASEQLPFRLIAA
jgi:hypothetical protein